MSDVIEKEKGKREIRIQKYNRHLLLIGESTKGWQHTIIKVLNENIHWNGSESPPLKYPHPNPF